MLGKETGVGCSFGTVPPCDPSPVTALLSTWLRLLLQVPTKSPLKYHVGSRGTTFSLDLQWKGRSKEQLQAGLSNYATTTSQFAMAKHWILCQSGKKTILWVLKCRSHRGPSETNRNLLLRGTTLYSLQAPSHQFGGVHISKVILHP